MSTKPSRLGLREEYGGGEEPTVDIVAVQGLGSKYASTWIKETKDGRRIMWLRDLLSKDMETARITTFEYDSKWFDDPDHVTLRDCARRLLRCLVYDRSHIRQSRMCSTRRKRPLIFIGHSFGGLVIKQALVFASKIGAHEADYEDFQNVVKATAGIIFLGTPHHGSEFAKWGLLKALTGQFLGWKAYPEQLKVLQIDSTTAILSELNDDFRNIRYSESLKNLKVVCFYETKEVSLGIVVTKESACLDDAVCEGLAANHMEMNKFTGEDDYPLVRKQLDIICDKANSIVSARFEAFTYTSPQCRPDLHELGTWLRPYSLATRREELQTCRAPGTCTWSLTHNYLESWLDSSASQLTTNGIWIFGKPGSGKSVLSEFLVEHLQKSHHLGPASEPTCDGNMQNDATCLTTNPRVKISVLYFFCRGKDEIEPSDIFRTMVNQLLRQHPESQKLHSIALQFKKEFDDPSASLLLELLLKLIKELKGAYIVLDGLDELARSPVQRLLELLGSVIESPQIKLLLLSQDEVFIRGAVVNRLSFGEALIDIANCNGNDIDEFIRKQTAALVRERTNLKSFEHLIVNSIREKSQGMFQWVSLMIGMLGSYGQESGDVERILEEFPPGLDPAYIRVLKRITEKPAFVVRRAQLALGWLICAIEPLTTRQLRTAIWLKEEDFSPSITEQTASEDELDFFFTNLLGPLVQIDSPRSRQQPEQSEDALTSLEADMRLGRRIRLCHYSLRQLLTGSLETVETEARTVHGVFRVDETEAHAVATKTCLLQLVAGDFNNLITSWYEEIVDPPLFYYAGAFWGKHAGQCPDAWTRDSGLVHSLYDLLTITLATSVEFLGQLSADLASRPSSQDEAMEDLLAFKQVQDAILPASRAVDAFKRSFPNKTVYSRIVQKTATLLLDGQVQQTRPLLSSLWHRFGVFRPKDSADSILTRGLRDLLKQFPQVDETVRPSFDTLARLSLSLRHVCMTISANPVRDWLYSYDVAPGEEAFANPVPLLAYSAFTTEFLMALPFILEVRSEDLAFGAQFQCDRPNRYYGLSALTMGELVARRAKAPDGFSWEENIARHRRIDYHRWIHVWFYFALFSPTHRGLSSLFSAWTKNYWAQQALHLPRGSFSRLSNPVYLLHRKGLQKLDTTFNFFIALRAVPGVFLLVVTQLIQRAVGPALWFLLLWQAQRLRMAKQNLSGALSLFQMAGLRDSIVGFALYCLRWKYWPYLGAHMNPHPLDDFQEVMENPLSWGTKTYGWRKTLKYYFWYALLQVAFVSAVSGYKKARKGDGVSLCRSFIAFHTFTFVERTVHMVANAFVTVFGLLAFVLYQVAWTGLWGLGRLAPYIPEPFVILSILFTFLVLAAMSFFWSLLRDPFGIAETTADLRTAQRIISKLTGKHHSRRILTRGTDGVAAVGTSRPRPTASDRVSMSHGKLKAE